MRFRLWLENVDLDQIVQSFPDRDQCSDQNYGMGDCDNISIRFLNHAKQFGLTGTLLAIDNPHQEPTGGWKPWGGDWKKTGGAISHYVAYFPSLKIAVDFSARQFWADAPVPMIIPLEDLQKSWGDFPFGLEDSRGHEGGNE
jgi:hypothetical protein